MITTGMSKYIKTHLPEQLLHLPVIFCKAECHSHLKMQIDTAQSFEVLEITLIEFF